MKKIGILLPLFSLPNELGIGSMGEEAYRFIDFLNKCGIKYWQILPLGITSFGDSPYQTLSCFAGGINYINLNYLLQDNLITIEELKQNKIISSMVSYGELFGKRIKILKKAYNRFLLNPSNDYEEFLKANSWLDDYALYMALKEHFNYQSLTDWPKEYKNKNSYENKIFKMENKDELSFHKFNQYLFFKQWNNLKKYASKKGIQIIGDLPMYVSNDSADVFSNPDVFMIDEDYKPKLKAGVPPDYFSSDGQLWGNPIYNYEYLKKTNYKWMIERFNHNLKMYDIIRLDHFRGYASYYVIDKNETTARNGHWEIGPRMELFKKIKHSIHMPLRKRVIAEDLGVLTDDVEKLLKDTHLGGMKVMQFGYPDMESTNYYKNFKKNQTVYSGTHDNDTTLGWFESLDEKTKQIVLKDLNTDEKHLVDTFLTKLINSKAKTIIIPLADFLKLDSRGRINIPGLDKGNWSFRIKEEDLNNQLIEHIKDIIK